MKVRAIMISEINEPDLISSINELAEIEELKPATAIKRFLRRKLPLAIELAKKQSVAEVKNLQEQSALEIIQ